MTKLPWCKKLMSDVDKAIKKVAKQQKRKGFLDDMKWVCVLLDPVLLGGSYQNIVSVLRVLKRAEHEIYQSLNAETRESLKKQMDEEIRGLAKKKGGKKP